MLLWFRFKEICYSSYLIIWCQDWFYLTKHFPYNPFTDLYIKTSNALYLMKYSLLRKGFFKKKTLHYLLFFISDVFPFRRHIFIWKRSRRSKIVSHILKSLHVFYQTLIKHVSLEKSPTKSYWVYMFINEIFCV